MRAALLAAFACSGFSGLVYQVVWARQFSLFLGHTTAAASAVVASVMGGLAVGAVVGARFAERWGGRRALQAYAVCEASAAALAMVVPVLVPLGTPVLRWSYADGDPGIAFGAARVAVCAIVLVPIATLLGATLPLATRWSREVSTRSARRAGVVAAAPLYAANTAGAATGAVAAGFFLLPALGLRGTTLVAASGSVIAAFVALWLARAVTLALAPAGVSSTVSPHAASPRPHATGTPKPRVGSRARAIPASDIVTGLGQQGTSGGACRTRWRTAVAVLALTGCATCLLEIVWSRLLAMAFGPSTYAFAAVVAVLIAGLAVGAVVGSAMSSGDARSTSLLAFSLGLAACATVWAAGQAGTALPRAAILHASTAASFPDVLGACLWWTTVLVGPGAVLVGMAFPLTLRLALVGGVSSERTVGTLYAVNTLASVVGALVGGFLAIPLAGLEWSIVAAAGAFAAAAALVGAQQPTARLRAAAALPLGATLIVMATSAPWSPALLAAGAYKYASAAGAHASEAALTAGALRYYREGAAGTVSVKDVGGVRSLAIDGKVDASTGADMLTQKLLAHLPLLIHPSARRVAVVGLGSGVTLASVLAHPVIQADVIEISPEVVEASGWFAEANQEALADPRTRLVVGDARSHLVLATRSYDVIISEPSNPWMAGVATLFTREFLERVRERLAPGGLLCQWIHTYDISAADVQSVVATFLSVFPHGTLWLVGEGDILLVGGESGPLPLDALPRGFERVRVASDLAGVGVRSAFEIYSLFAAGPAALSRFAAGAPIQRDDRLALEFSGPYGLYGRAASDVPTVLRALGAAERMPAAVTRAIDGARAEDWRARAAMLLAAQAPEAAYESFARALSLDPSDAVALDGYVRSAIAAARTDEALAWLRRTGPAGSAAVRHVAASKLLLSRGAVDEAIAAAEAAAGVLPLAPEGAEQLAALYADLGDPARVESAVAWLQRYFPAHPSVPYYVATAAFLRGDLASAIDGARRATAGVSPRPASVHNLLGAALARAGRFDEARTTLETAKRLDPRDSSVYVNLATVALDVGQLPAAAAAFAEALALDPQSRVARQGLEAVARGIRNP